VQFGVSPRPHLIWICGNQKQAPLIAGGINPILLIKIKLIMKLQSDEALKIKELLFTQSPENIELAAQICKGLRVGQGTFLKKYVLECNMFPLFLCKSPANRVFSAFLDFKAFSCFKICGHKFDLSLIPPLQSIKTFAAIESNIGQSFKGMPCLPNLESIHISFCKAPLSLEGMPFFPKLKEVVFYHSKIISLKGLPIIRELKIHGQNSLSLEKRKYKAYTKIAYGIKPLLSGIANAHAPLIYEYPVQFWDAQHPLIKSTLAFYF